MKNKTKVIGFDWNFASLFNEAIRSMPERDLKQRGYIYASEIGGDYTTRYLRMNAHPYTNPYNDRSKRKMIAGTIFEWIVMFVLTSCGVLKQKQLHGEVKLDGCLPVTGRLDFIAGGSVDWDAAKEQAERLRSLFGTCVDDMPPIVFYSVDKILTRMAEMFRLSPLKEVVLECKSVSGFVGDLIERSNKPRHPHPLQTLHYVIANKMDGEIVYVNRDSFMCYQFGVKPTKELLRQYHDDVQTMTNYYENRGKNYLKNMPPKPAEVIFEEASFRFVKNNFVEYSPYLTFMYPQYKSFDNFKEKWAKPISQFNRVFKRCVMNDNLTAANKEIIAEAKKQFPNWDMFVEQAKKSGHFDNSDENDAE